MPVSTDDIIAGGMIGYASMAKLNLTNTYKIHGKIMSFSIIIW